jgi:DNA-binding transcriptional MerR regulator
MDAMVPEEKSFAIGELAEEFGLTLRALRHYEDEGLLRPRREGQARIYDYRDRARLALICRGKRLGFTLAEIKEFIGLYDVDPGQRQQMEYALNHARTRIAALEIQLKDVEHTLVELRKIEGAILDFLKTNPPPRS